MTITLVGAVIGGIVFGILSDRLGRVRVLTWTIVLFAVFTGMCALAQGYWDLLLYRGIAGLGLGGEFGIGMALVAEAWPAAKRARASSYVGLGWQSGVLLAAVVTPLLLPVIGWRGMFVVGIFPALVAYVIRRNPARARGLHRQQGAAIPTPAFSTAAADGGQGDRQDESGHDHSLLGAELRLLRHHDLAAELPLDPVQLRPDAIGGVDSGDHRRHGARHLSCSGTSRIASAAGRLSSAT